MQKKATDALWDVARMSLLIQLALGPKKFPS
jgi:hypothetical protein